MNNQLVRETIEDLLSLLGEAPERNCSCHISPPCNDCVDWSQHREVVKNAKSLAAELTQMEAAERFAFEQRARQGVA